MRAASGPRNPVESTVRSAVQASGERWRKKRKFLIPGERAGLLENRFFRRFQQYQPWRIVRWLRMGKVFGVAHRPKSRKIAD